MSAVLESILARRSVRSYKSDAVPKEKIKRIAEAGSYAATGRNRQSPIILAVTDKALRDELSKMNAAIMGTEQDPFYNAPVIFVVLADKSAPTYLYDGSLVLGNMMLAAQAEGLGSCWIHRAKEEFETERGKEILASLGIAGDYEGIGHLAVGYANEPKREAPPRKNGYITYID
ncbi:MAG: nitroreductase [Clostridia bacterium]|nr:nitroreductase [Clostridia bacterium]